MTDKQITINLGASTADFMCSLNRANKQLKASRRGVVARVARKLAWKVIRWTA